MKKLIICLCLFFCLSCTDKSKPYSIAIDKNWYSITLDGQEKALNGFIADILMEIAKDNKIEINLIEVNWDDIFDGLYLNRYQAIFSAIEPYNFNKAKFDFSENIIQTGYVLVISKNADYESLKDMQNNHVGYIRGSNSLLILQKYINIFDETYDSIPKMLGDITKLKLEGAILSVVPAFKYVSDLFYNELKLVYPLINDQAIRLLTLKSQNNDLLKMFNSTLDKLKKNGKMEKLLIKWGLPNL